MMLEINEPCSSNGARRALRRLGLALLIGTTVTAIAFGLTTVGKAPWQLNYLLAPGGLGALFLGFGLYRLGLASHYGDHAYVAVFLVANVGFYGIVTFMLLAFSSRLRSRTSGVIRSNQ
jgi:hypothetical protein